MNPAAVLREIQSVVKADNLISNEFRKRVWHNGVKLPHQGNRECARRAGKRA